MLLSYIPALASSLVRQDPWRLVLSTGAVDHLATQGSYWASALSFSSPPLSLLFFLPLLSLLFPFSQLMANYFIAQQASSPRCPRASLLSGHSPPAVVEGSKSIPWPETAPLSPHLRSVLLKLTRTCSQAASRNSPLICIKSPWEIESSHLAPGGSPDLALTPLWVHPLPLPSRRPAPYFCGSHRPPSTCSTQSPSPAPRERPLREPPMRCVLGSSCCTCSRPSASSLTWLPLQNVSCPRASLSLTLLLPKGLTLCRFYQVTGISDLQPN